MTPPRVLYERDNFRLVYEQRKDGIVDLTLEWQDKDALGDNRWRYLRSACLYEAPRHKILIANNIEMHYNVMLMLLLNSLYEKPIEKRGAD